MIVNNIKFFWGLIRVRLGRRIPLTVIVNVTDRCNSRCRHCYASYYRRDSKDEMSLQQIKRAIRDLQENGCLRITLAGGEPLLRRDIGKIINFAKRLGINVGLFSNGFLIPNYISDLKNLDTLTVSLDGQKKNHDILRGDGSWEKAMTGIKAALKAKVVVNVNMVVNRYNFRDVDYILDLAEKMGFRVEFGLAISNIFGEGISSQEIKPSDKQIQQVLRKLIIKKERGAPIVFSKVAFKSVLSAWKDFSKEMMETAPRGMPSCPAGKFFALIEADGNLWPCPHLINKTKTVNIVKEGIKKGWRVAGNHSCQGCYQIYHHEFGHLMALNPAVVWNYFKEVIGCH